jgi:hypothetical protein
VSTCRGIAYADLTGESGSPAAQMKRQAAALGDHARSRRVACTRSGPPVRRRRLRRRRSRSRRSCISRASPGASSRDSRTEVERRARWVLDLDRRDRARLRRRRSLRRRSVGAGRAGRASGRRPRGRPSSTSRA